MTQPKHSWWEQIVRGLRPDEPWHADVTSTLGVESVHAWAVFHFKTFNEFSRMLTEVVNRVEAYHVEAPHVMVEVYHGYGGWAFDLDLLIPLVDHKSEQSIRDMLAAAPADGDAAATIYRVGGEPVAEVSHD